MAANQGESISPIRPVSPSCQYGYRGLCETGSHPSRTRLVRHYHPRHARKTHRQYLGVSRRLLPRGAALVRTRSHPRPAAENRAARQRVRLAGALLGRVHGSGEKKGLRPQLGTRSSAGRKRTGVASHAGTTVRAGSSERSPEPDAVATNDCSIRPLCGRRSTMYLRITLRKRSVASGHGWRVCGSASASSAWFPGLVTKL